MTTDFIQRGYNASVYCIFKYQVKAMQLISNTAIIIPDDVSEEKEKALRALGADVERVRPASIVDKSQVCLFISANISNLNLVLLYSMS
jgi:hypothetical protein